VQLGATKPDGLPLDLFSSDDARWMGVSVNGGQEQPRVLLLSVPYALKAADAETIGGLPPSAAATGTGTKTAPTAPIAKNAGPLANPAVTGKGVVDFIPMWDSTSDIVDSLIFQKSSQVGRGLWKSCPSSIHNPLMLTHPTGLDRQQTAAVPNGVNYPGLEALLRGRRQDA
jgi:hypothetical protein